jgi:N-acetylglucosamine kinase-like BadF-type ATPase
MIAVVYSGSRHANWKLAEKGTTILEFKTPGINPFFNDENCITQFLNKNIHLINNAEKIKWVYFFGAGASSTERKEIVANALGRFFRFSKVIVDHDLKAAALAASGDEAGILGIIGSGSNAAYFDGKKIIENNFGLGYILGDEGSSNWLGRRLLKSYLNDLLPEEIEFKFKKKYDLDRTQILDKVYRQAQTSLFLSSFTDFLMENKENIFIKNMIIDGFDKYFKTYIITLKEQYPTVPIHIIGMIAAGFEDYLHQAALNNNLTVSSVIKEPIYNLLKYYSNKN